MSLPSSTGSTDFDGMNIVVDDEIGGFYVAFPGRL